MNQTAVTANEYIHHHLTNSSLSVKTWSFTTTPDFWTVNIDTLIVSIVVGLLFFVAFYLAARKATNGVPGKWQNMVEALIEWVGGLCTENFPAAITFVGPLALTIFAWVFLMNFMDLVPVDLLPAIAGWFGLQYFRAVPTADINTTLGLSLGVFMLLIYYNLKFKGVIGRIKELLQTPYGIWLLPLNLAFHTIEAFVKPFSLALRLFGNLFAGEMIFVLIAALLPFWLQPPIGLVWSFLHFLIITIQAFIFMFLTVMYASMAASEH